MKKFVIFLLLIIFSTILAQAQNMVYQAIQGYGGVIPVPFETEKPDFSIRHLSWSKKGLVEIYRNIRFDYIRLPGNGIIK